MVNTTRDDLFPPEAALTLFDAFPYGHKRMMLWEGDHSSEPPEMINLFINRHASRS